MCTLPDLPGHGASALGEAAETELVRTRLPKKKGAISKTCPNSNGRRLHVEKDRNYRSLNNSHHYYCAQFPNAKIGYLLAFSKLRPLHQARAKPKALLAQSLRSW